MTDLEPRAVKAIENALRGDKKLLMQMTLPAAVRTAFEMGYKFDLKFVPHKNNKWVWHARFDFKRWRTEIVRQVWPPVLAACLLLTSVASAQVEFNPVTEMPSTYAMCVADAVWWRSRHRSDCLEVARAARESVYRSGHVRSNEWRCGFEYIDWDCVDREGSVWISGNCAWDENEIYVEYAADEWEAELILYDSVGCYWYPTCDTGIKLPYDCSREYDDCTDYGASMWEEAEEIIDRYWDPFSEPPTYYSEDVTEDNPYDAASYFLHCKDNKLPRGIAWCGEIQYHLCFWAWQVGPDVPFPKKHEYVYSDEDHSPAKEEWMYSEVKLPWVGGTSAYNAKLHFIKSQTATFDFKPISDKEQAGIPAHAEAVCVTPDCLNRSTWDPIEQTENEPWPHIDFCLYVTGHTPKPGVLDYLYKTYLYAPPDGKLQHAHPPNPHCCLDGCVGDRCKECEDDDCR